MDAVLGNGNYTGAFEAFAVVDKLIPGLRIELGTGALVQLGVAIHLEGNHVLGNGVKAAFVGQRLSVERVDGLQPIFAWDIPRRSLEVLRHIEDVPLVYVSVGQAGLGRGKRHDIRRVSLHDANHQFLVAAAAAAGRLDLDLWVRLAETIHGPPHELIDRYLGGGRLKVGDLQHVFPGQVPAAPASDGRSGHVFKKVPALHDQPFNAPTVRPSVMRFCNRINTTIRGSMTITRPANNSVQRDSVDMFQNRVCRPRASV